MDELFERFEESLEPEDYARYLEVRRKREKTGFRHRRMKFEGRNIGTVGVNPVHPKFEHGWTGMLKRLDEAEKRVTLRLKQKYQRIRENPKQGKIIKGDNNMGSFEDNVSVYTAEEIVDKFGVNRQTIGMLRRHGTIPAEAVVTKGVYRKDVIDQLAAEGLFTTTAQQRYMQRKKAGQQIKKRGDSPRIETASGHTDLSPFWSSHTDLAVAVLAQPEQTRSLVLRCMDELFMYLENEH